MTGGGAAARRLTVRLATCMSVSLALAACALDEAGGGGGGEGGGIESRFATDPSDTAPAKMVEGGITGDLAELSALANRSRPRAALLEVSPDYQTVFLTLGGTRYRMVPASALPGSANGGLFADADGNTVSLLALDGGYSASVQFTSGGGGVLAYGVLGAETPAAMLPDVTVAYSGTFNLTGNPLLPVTGRSGFADITVDFASGGVTGDFREGLASEAFGRLTAEVTGNGVAGALVLSGADLSGTLDARGTFFGPGAQELGGVLTGKMQVPGGEAAVSGQFQTRCSEAC